MTIGSNLRLRKRGGRRQVMILRYQFAGAQMQHFPPERSAREIIRVYIAKECKARRNVESKYVKRIKER